MNKFEKISFQQFSKDIKKDMELYSDYNIPKRSTKSSAGYDFKIIQNIVLNPKEQLLVPTGIKCKMDDNVALFLIVRSSIGIKKNIVLSNQVGIIDSDYYNNKSNEGHIFLALKNTSDKKIELEQGTRVVQGVLMPYLLADEEEITKTREGGIGSTKEA